MILVYYKAASTPPSHIHFPLSRTKNRYRNIYIFLMLPCIIYNSSSSAHLTGFVMCLHALLPDAVVSTLKAESGSSTAEMLLTWFPMSLKQQKKMGWIIMLPHKDSQERENIIIFLYWPTRSRNTNASFSLEYATWLNHYNEASICRWNRLIIYLEW